ncbi:MAG: serine/threonine-protein kinase [Polyangiaceae bacterium]
MSRQSGSTSPAVAFEYLAEIAVGSTARIDLCRARGGEREGQLLAVKRLLPHIAEDPTHASMFLDEVWMTASLKHPNVVEVAGWGTDEHGGYLAVELVQGVSLARLMKTVFDTGEVFSERMVVFIGAKACAGLAAAHALRSPDGEHLHLVHRDFTPQNVLVGFNGDVKIADFGLAKAKQRITKTLTGLLKGQPQYMSPEQAKGGQEIDARSDLFSLGVVLFELFAARRPWSATSELEMVHVAANEPAADLREFRPKIDRELVNVVMTCLERDPAVRFQTAAEVQSRLESWLLSHGYAEGSDDALARFVRRNAMRQMRWFERAVAGDLAPMPESMRPGLARQEPPRVPSYSNVTNAPHERGEVAPRARVRLRRPAVDSELTDVTDITDADAKVALLHAQSLREPPRITHMEDDGGPESDGEWGEEVPTLVQKPGQAGAALLARVRPRAPRSNAPLPFTGALVDEDSQRTTAVKRPSRPVPIEVRAETATSPLHHRAKSLADVDSEGDAEEIPTLPLKHRVHRPPHRPPGPPPSHGPAPPLAAPSSRPAQAAAVHPLAADEPPTQVASRRLAPPDTMQGGVALGASGELHTPSGLRVMDVAPHMPVPPRQERGLLAEPRQERGLLAEPRQERGLLAERPVTEPALRAEADRLAQEAMRLGEEAKGAAAVAVRKTTLAKMAGDAATIAAEAVRLVAAAGLERGAQRMDEALALEAALRRGELGPMGPMAGMHPPPNGALHPGALIDPRRITGPAEMPPPSGRFDTNPSGMMRPSFEPPAMMVPDHLRSTFDPQSFRAQLKPEILGIPRPVAIALFAACFLALVIFAWVVL